MVEIEDFSRMVSRVYAAASAPETWMDAMAEIRAVFGALTAAVIETDGVERAPKVANLSAEARRAYVEYYRRLDYVLAAVEDGPVGLVRDGRSLIALQPNSEFDADWMRPHLLRDGLFVRLSGGEVTASFLVAADWPESDRDGPERLATLESLVPHLQQALHLERSLRRHAVTRTDLTVTMEHAGRGIVVVDADRTVLQLNRRAEDILAAGDGLLLRGKAVAALDRTADDRLARAVRTAAGRGDPVRASRSVPCPRPSGRRPYVVHVLPPPEDRHAACAHLVLIDTEAAPETPTAVLRRLFGLTAAEAVVAVRVVGGDPLQVVADDLAVSLATVKTHLQHVFAKTGVHRQAELARLLMTIAP